MQSVRNLLLRYPLILVGAAFALVLFLSVTAGGYFLTQTRPAQPIEFPHRTHVLIGAQCIFCHPGATWGPTAGLPSTSKCWGCHQQMDVESEELDKLADFARSGEEIPWVPVAILPDFTHFNHQPHIAYGLSCETCHGDVGEMTVAQPQPQQNMGWCLNCHREMEPENWQHLSDCSLCHY